MATVSCIGIFRIEQEEFDEKGGGGGGSALYESRV